LEAEVKSLVVLVGSVILPDFDTRMENRSIRSAFTASERLIQTVSTLHSLQVQLPQARIVLCDASEPDYSEWLQTVFPEVTYLHLASQDPIAARVIQSCGNKSLGECQLLLHCWARCRELIREADFVLKVSGRYMLEHIDPQQFEAFSPDCYLFPESQPSDVRPWIEPGGRSWELARNPRFPTEQRQVLRTVCYGWGRQQNEAYFAAISRILYDLHRPEYRFYDIENLLARELAGEPIVRTPWRYLGWNGLTGDFVRF
jgi:hypothetical protein